MKDSPASIENQSSGTMTKSCADFEKWLGCFFVFQYFLGIIVAWSLIPGTAGAMEKLLHPSVIFAICVGGAISVCPIYFAFFGNGKRVTRVMMAITMPLMSLLLLHLAGGRVEVQFHAFVAIALLSYYRETQLLVLAASLLIVEHFLVGLFFPLSIFAEQVANPALRTMEFGFWLTAEVAFLVFSIQSSEEELRSRSGKVLESNENLRVESQSLAKRVAQRTAELEKANEVLSESARLKDQFLANMSHELRTPLNSILGLSEAFTNGFYGSISEKQNDKIKSIEKSGRHLLDLINDVLDVAKFGSGEMNLEVSTVTVSEVVDSSLTFVKTQASRKGLKLTSEISEDISRFTGDERRIKQILVNLLSNAVKFTESGSVTLIVAAVDDQVEFRVKDTGIGIPENKLYNLFVPFVQIDSSLTRVHDGTGLGLTLVKQMVELHGGEVRVESEVGVGSEFIVSLPMSDLSAEVVDSENSKQDELTEPEKFMGDTLIPDRFDPGFESSDFHILVAEDNEANIEVITDILETCGFHFSVAKDGNQALELCRSIKPDLVLMDIQMPEKDGITAIKELRSDRAIQHIPVIAQTAWAMTGDRETCIEAGADRYLGKPIDVKELMAAITELLSEERSVSLSR